VFPKPGLNSSPLAQLALAEREYNVLPLITDSSALFESKNKFVLHQRIPTIHFNNILVQAQQEERP
jgi:hypothetical protein